MASSGAEFIFTTFEFGGHVTPALATAARLQAQGRRVLILSDEATREEAAGFDLPFRAWVRAPNRPDKRVANEPLRDWECGTPAEVIAMLLDRLMTGRAADYAADTVAALDANPDAVVVSQELLLGCMAAAQARGRRAGAAHGQRVALADARGACRRSARGWSRPTDEQGVWFQGLIREASRSLYDGGLPQLNSARAEWGLPPLSRTLDQIDAADLILLSAARAYDFAPPPAPGAVPLRRPAGARAGLGRAVALALGATMIRARWCWCRSRRSTRRRSRSCAG